MHIAAFVWVVLIGYLGIGVWLHTQYPLKERKGKAVETIVLWMGYYLNDGINCLIWRGIRDGKSSLVKLYLQEDWEALLRTVPVWSNRYLHRECSVVMYAVLPAEVYPNAIGFPPFRGYDSTSKDGKKEVLRLSSVFTYQKDENGFAKWTIPAGLDSELVASVGDIIVMDLNQREHCVYGVITPNELKNYQPW